MEVWKVALLKVGTGRGAEQPAEQRDS